MSIVTGEYEAFHNLRRKGITLLCLALAASLTTGIAVFVDSAGYYRWSEFIDSRPVAIHLYGIGLAEHVTDIRQVDHVERVAVAYYGWVTTYVNSSTLHPVEPSSVRLQRTWLARPGHKAQQINFTEWHGVDLDAMSVGPDFYQAFPQLFKRITGRLPANETEVAVSEDVSSWLNVSIGERVGIAPFGTAYSSQSSGASASSVANDSAGGLQADGEDIALATIVGIYTPVSADNFLFAPLTTQMIIGLPALANHGDEMLYIEIDRRPLTPANVPASLEYLTSVETDILRTIDPYYVPGSSYEPCSVDNLLADGVIEYKHWLDSTRLTQVFNSGGELLMVILVVVMAVRYNINDRRPEIEVLRARGASQRTINLRIFKEFVALSVLATVLGLIGGIGASRISMASRGYLVVDPSRLLTEPLIVSIDSLLFSIVMSSLMLFASGIVYQRAFARPRRQTRKGLVVRIGKLLTMIRWEFVTIILSVLLLWSLYSSGGTVMASSVVGVFARMALTFAPLAIFLAVGSLFSKWLRRGAMTFSRRGTRVFGPLPARVGIRRPGRRTSSAALVTIVIVFAIGLTWTNLTVAASLPATKEAQARYTFCSDILFHLEYGQSEFWPRLMENLSAIDSVRAWSLSSHLYLELSNYEIYRFVGLNASEMMQIGYDYLGRPIRESPVAQALQQLQARQAGAIITKSIAETYGLSEGDAIRAFIRRGGDNATIVTFVVVGIMEALSPIGMVDTGTTGMGYYYWLGEVGYDVVWVNEAYLDLFFAPEERSWSLTVGLAPRTNSTQVGESILEQGGGAALSDPPYSDVTSEVAGFLHQEAYEITQSVDTLLTVMSILTVPVVFVLYASENIGHRRREIALLRAAGVTRGEVLKIEATEMAFLTLMATLLLLVIGPIIVSNALLTVHTTSYSYHFVVIPVFPVVLLAAVYLLFLVAAFFFAFLVACFSTRIRLAEALNASWTESGPFGRGEE